MDDLRESASVNLISSLLKKNFKKVDYSDPYIKSRISTKNFKFNKKGIELNSKNLKKFDIAIIMTDHDKLDYKFIYKYSKTIIDCRGRYPVDQKVYRA